MARTCADIGLVQLAGECQRQVGQDALNLGDVPPIGGRLDEGQVGELVYCIVVAPLREMWPAQSEPADYVF